MNEGIFYLIVALLTHEAVKSIDRVQHGQIIVRPQKRFVGLAVSQEHKYSMWYGVQFCGLKTKEKCHF